MSDVVHVREQKARRIYITLRNLLLTIIALAIVAILVVVTITAIDTHRNTQQLINCTTPNHSCYEQGRDATQGAVGTIAKIIILASFCEKNLDHGATETQVEACVNAGLNPK